MLKKGRSALTGSFQIHPRRFIFMIASEVREMLFFIDGNPTAYHTTAAVRDILLKALGK
jgi:aspartyl aminopeptidase